MITAIVQLLAFIGFQAILDMERLSRKTRAFVGYAILFTCVAGAYSGEAGWFYSHPRGFMTAANGVDWSESGFAGFFIIFIIFQVAAAIGPMYLCWYVAAAADLGRFHQTQITKKTFRI